RRSDGRAALGPAARTARPPGARRTRPHRRRHDQRLRRLRRRLLDRPRGRPSRRPRGRAPRRRALAALPGRRRGHRGGRLQRPLQGHDGRGPPRHRRGAPAGGDAGGPGAPRRAALGPDAAAGPRGRRGGRMRGNGGTSAPSSRLLHSILPLHPRAPDVPSRPNPSDTPMPRTPFNTDDAFLFEQLLSEEDRLVMQSAREYAQSKLEPRALEGNQDEVFHAEIPREMAEMGLLGATIPEEYGGLGASYTAYGLIARELERVDSGYRSFASVQSSLVMYPIHAFGTEEQRRRFLPKLASAEMIGCFGLTEPNHGSDPGSMETTATRVDGGFVLNGAKMWITNSPIADVGVVWAKSKGDGEDGVIRGFLVEKGMDGYTAPKTHNKMSLRASITGEMVFDDCFVPDENVFPEIRGLKGPFSCLNNARYGIAWGAVGAAENCYQRARTYVMERKQF